jgi:hypothetical protein
MAPEFLFYFSKEEEERYKIFTESPVWKYLEEICREKKLFLWRQDKLFEWKEEKRSEDDKPAYFNPNYTWNEVRLLFNQWWDIKDLGSGWKKEIFCWESVRFRIDNESKKMILFYDGDDGNIESILDENKIIEALDDVVNKNSCGEKSKYAWEVRSS